MALKLYVENGQSKPAVQYVDDGAPPSGYTDKNDDIPSWALYGLRIWNNAELRNYFVDNFLPDWGTMSDANKKLLIELFVWDENATDEELDTLYSDIEREEFAAESMRLHRKLGCVITHSTTVSSKKYINWTADDLAAVTTVTINAWDKIV